MNINIKFFENKIYTQVGFIVEFVEVDNASEYDSNFAVILGVGRGTFQRFGNMPEIKKNPHLGTQIIKLFQNNRHNFKGDEKKMQ